LLHNMYGPLEMWRTTNQTSKYSGCTPVLHKYPYLKIRYSHFH